MIVTYQREKLINAVLLFARNTKFCGKTKLMKLLYFLDFTHFKQTGRPVTELDYYAWDQGPVPKDFFEEISQQMMPADLTKAFSIKKLGEKFEAIVPKVKVDKNYFSARELRIIDNLCEIHSTVKAEDISEISHLENHPWDKTKKEQGMFSKIDYLLAIDSKRDSLPLEVARERSKSRKEMYNRYGVV